LTDGLIPKAMVSILGTPAQARRLVAAGLWTITADGDYQFHQWCEDGSGGKRQPSAEEIKTRRRQDAARKAAGRGTRNSAEPQVSALRPAGHDADSEQTPRRIQLSRPDPTRPGPSSSEELGRGERLSEYAPASPPPPSSAGTNNGQDGPARCVRHAHLPAADPGPPCRACGEIRREREQAGRANLDASQDAATAERETRRRTRDECTACDSEGWALGPDGLVADPAMKCRHRAALRAVAS
jgi:hypothetical protein